MESAASDVRVVGRYSLYDTIASGGMATVRFGRLNGPAGFSRTVAVKCLYPPFASDPEFVAMFLDEARLVARIRSPNVVPAIDVVHLEGELFIVMEYVGGESLARLLRPASEGRAGAPVPVPVAVAIACNVLEGLHAAHETRSEQGAPLDIVHRDVSPQNILVGTDGLGHVIDFGVAKAAGRLQTTRDGQLKGKLAYMAPEQLRGEAVTRRSDIYAASVVLWEALTGERLFRADDEGAVVTRVLMGAVDPPSKGIKRGRDAEAVRAIERLDAVVMRGIARAPGERFETARAMGVALQECVTPASPAAVSEWLQEVAGATLAQRAARLAEIESGKGPKNDRAMSQLETVPDGMAPHAIDVELDGSNQTTTQASSISVVSNVTSMPRVRARRTRALVASLLAVLLLAAYGTARWVRATKEPPPVAAAAVSVEPAPPPSAPPAPESAAVAASAPASTPPTTTSAAPATPSVPRTPPGRSPASTTKRPPAPASSDCDPPFTWDARGKKHYKSNCL